LSAVFDSGFRKLLAEILRRAPRLRGGRQGEFRSRRRRRAGSGTFSGHRGYSVGEDLRMLDWNVYARTDELFLKVLEDQDLRAMTLVLDCSHSMRAGPRWRGALRLCAILGGLALTRMDGLRVVVGPGQQHVLEGPRAVAGYLELLAGLQPRDLLPEQLARLVVERGGHGRVAWVSDFAAPESMRPALRLLRQMGCYCAGWLPETEDDRAPTVAGHVLFCDPETGRQELMMVDAALREAMVAELLALARLQDLVFGRAGFRLRRYRLPADDDLALSSWLGGFAGDHAGAPGAAVQGGSWLAHI
jgi:uncharacterized protein (DUF58 family)